MDTRKDEPKSEPPHVPDEFVRVINDFMTEFISTFPEFRENVSEWWNCERGQALNDQTMPYLFLYCLEKWPPRFFDILYQNEEMFLIKEKSKQSNKSKKNKIKSQTDKGSAEENGVYLLPNVDFCEVWKCDISLQTRNVLWKYLQLILFSTVGSLENKDAFGDTAKLFEAIDEGDFKQKLQDTLGQIYEMFQLGKEGEQDGQDEQPEGRKGEHPFGLDDLPNAEQMNEHISGMMGGKIGRLAQEIAEETANSFNEEFQDARSTQDIFQTLLKNPTRLMDLVKKVGEKLDAKLKSGELKESEMLKEATDIMNQMKSIPGMGNLQSMLGKMGMGGLAGMMGGGGGKMNTAAMQSKMNQRMKMAKTKERIRAKAEAAALRKQMESVATSSLSDANTNNTSHASSTFSAGTGEKMEKTPRGAKPVSESVVVNTPLDQKTKPKKKKKNK